ncbi:MAG: hypothetical protein EXR65_01965 [Dehalococcoidia bacterium]|nr:hypothetical protein [Dehalococcoidia bacterium]
MTATQDALDALNPAQRHAVTVRGGPLLILAGPGSGKTRVIAHRIAYLVRTLAVPPWRILAVTFTNKAAREMRERVERLLEEDARAITLGTFHGICARMLRRDGQQIGIPSGFVIYDRDDQLSLVRRIEKELHVDSKRFAPGAVLSAISAAKNHRLDAAGYAGAVGSYFEEVVARVFEQYDHALTESAAVDFDDLLGRTLELFQRAPAVCDRYAERYLHLLIDEFQDTNVVQYELARALTSKHGNITAVGDPDQSIYSWRAADVRNLAHFRSDFPGTEVVLLEQNYRSSARILRVADAVIRRAEGRPEKQLWTANADGERVVEHSARSGEEEAMYIASEVQRLTRGGRAPADCAVMYRTNAQSRALEEAFLYLGIPYRLVGGTRFYDRREVRDLLAYLRLVQNEMDSVAFQRIVNVPPRGIGDRTLEHVLAVAAETGLAPLAVAAKLARGDAALPALPALRADSRLALDGFVRLVDSLRERRERFSVADLLDEILRDVGYRQYLQDSDEAHATTRWENVEELLEVARQYQDLEGSRSLASFLEEVALVADVDDPAVATPNAVTLTTLHAAKGLEFPVVFMPGLEEGLLPHVRSLDDPQQLEEERRIAYVGMTRAKERLYLLHAGSRFYQGMQRRSIRSRFLRDVPSAELTASGTGAATAGAVPLSARERRAAIAGRQVRDVPSEPAFAAGERVEHAQFGRGVVVSCTLVPGDQQVTVAFEAAGVRKLLLSFAPLKAERRPEPTRAAVPDDHEPPEDEAGAG